MINENILPLGIMTNLHGEDAAEPLGRARDMGFPTCQLNNPPDSFLTGPRAKELTAKFREQVAASGVKVTSVFIMFDGHIWDLVDGPRTIGLVPSSTRGERMVRACRISNWAREAGIDAVTSHIGFIPEDPNDPEYRPFIEMMKAFCSYCADNGQTFAFETGQETAETLKRTIEDIGMENVGVNLDPANLILYGKSRPLEAVELIGKYVLNTHCKDGVWPAPGGKLGEEVALGEGEVNIRALIPRLFELGYRGPLTIEREIEGDQQIADIRRAKELLESIREPLLARA
jgi:sugar phosphate isomerase/epimerase